MAKLPGKVRARLEGGPWDKTTVQVAWKHPFQERLVGPAPDHQDYEFHGSVYAYSGKTLKSGLRLYRWTGEREEA